MQARNSMWRPHPLSSRAHAGRRSSPTRRARRQGPPGCKEARGVPPARHCSRTPGCRPASQLPRTRPSQPPPQAVPPRSVGCSPRRLSHRPWKRSGQLDGSQVERCWLLGVDLVLRRSWVFSPPLHDQKLRRYLSSCCSLSTL